MTPRKLDTRTPDDIALDMELLKLIELSILKLIRDYKVARLARTYVIHRESGSAGPHLHEHYNALRKAVLGGEG